MIGPHQQFQPPAQDQNGATLDGRVYLDFDQDGLPELLAHYSDGWGTASARVYRVVENLGEGPDPYAVDACMSYPDPLGENGEDYESLTSFLNGAGWGTTGYLIRFPDGQYGLLSRYLMRYGYGEDDLEEREIVTRFQGGYFSSGFFFMKTDETDYEVVLNLGVYDDLPDDPQTFLHAAPLTAYPSTQSVNVDSADLTFKMYALKDSNGNLTNYINIRDLAMALSGTAAQYNVGYYSNMVHLVSGAAYTLTGSEGDPPFSGQQPCTKSTAQTDVNGTPMDLDSIVLHDQNGGGYTYYQLRDLGRVLGFNVGWNGYQIYIETDTPYDPAN